MADIADFTDEWGLSVLLDPHSAIDKVYTLSTFGDTIAPMQIHFKCGDDSFVWLESKAHKNVNKHGVRFEEAATVFGDPNFVLVDSSRNDEARDAVIGFDPTADGSRAFCISH